MKNLAERLLDEMINKINQITASLDGTIAQIESLNRKVEENSKNLMENLTAVNENMRLIIEVIKQGRANTKETLEEVQNSIHDEIEKLWNEKALENLTKDEISAVNKLKDINKEVSENLYLQQILTIIASLREIAGRATAVKIQKQTN